MPPPLLFGKLRHLERSIGFQGQGVEALLSRGELVDPFVTLGFQLSFRLSIRGACRQQEESISTVAKANSNFFKVSKGLIIDNAI